MYKGKFILNVQQSALAKSSSAWDALKYAPTVITSSAGSLTVLNKPTVVYIDGRRVHQSGEALMQYLQGIPASNIDKIEVIGHPDPSYAADISTVIKISTIKYKDDGIKGNITFRGIKASFLHKYINGTVNYKKGALYLQSGYGYSYAKNKIINNYEKLGQTGYVWLIPQQSISSTNTNRFHTTLGYDFNKNNKLTFYTDITPSTNHSNLKANNGSFTDDRSNDSIYRFNAKGSNKSTSIQSQMTYETIFGEGKQPLKFELEYFHNRQNNLNKYSNDIYDLLKAEYISDYNKMDVLPQSLNTWVGYITNTTKLLGEEFSYGLRFSQNQILNDDSTYDNSSIPLQLLASQKVSYKETNYAAFTSWQKQIKNLFIQLGLRIENNKIDSQSDSLNAVVNYNWFNVFPNLLFQYSKTASSYWILSFNKSFKRPDYSLPQKTDYRHSASN